MIILVVVNLMIGSSLKQRICHPCFLRMEMVFLNKITASVILCCQALVIVKVKYGFAVDRFLDAHTIRMVSVLSYRNGINFHGNQSLFMVVHIFRDLPIFGFCMGVTINIVGIGRCIGFCNLVLIVVSQFFRGGIG